MIRIYTEDEWNEVWWEGLKSSEIICNVDETESVVNWNHSLLSGQFRRISLRSGLKVELFNSVYQQTFGVDTKDENNPFLTLAFAIVGLFRSQTFGVKADYCEQPGESYLFYIDQVREIESCLEEHLLNIRIRVAPHLLRSLSADQGWSLPDELRLFLETDNPPLFHRAVGKQTSAMQQALQDILQCRLQGMMRRVYLEAKALELMALQFAQLVSRPPDTQRSPSLKPDDRDRIYQARDILIRNLTHPPSVLDLAQQVGINEFKLRQGFHEIFGNTVFGCLRDTQMQEARQLLLERNTTVAGVAARIGYASRTAFNAAFRKQFGMSPKEYQMADRIR